MYTRTTRPTAARNSTTNNRGRGGRGNGRGRQTNHKSTFNHPNISNEDYDDNYPINERRGGPSMFSQNRGNHQYASRGHGNYRANINSSSTSSRSDNAGKSSSSDSDSSRVPKHAQNPFFVRELMSRFNNMLPSSTMLEDDVPNAQHLSTNSNPNNVSNNILTLETIRSSMAPRSSDSITNKNSGSCNQSGIKNVSQEKRICESGNNKSGDKNNFYSNDGNPQSNFRLEEPSAGFKSRDRKSENLSMNDNYVLGKSINHNQNQTATHEPHSNIYHRKTSTSSMKSTNSSKAGSRITLEKRKAIMESCGFPIDLSNHQNSDSGAKIQDTNKRSQDYIADRTTPRVRHNLESKPTHDSSFSTEQNKTDGSKCKPASQHPQNSSVLDFGKYRKSDKFEHFNPHNDTSNKQNGSTSIGRYSDRNVVNCEEIKTENTNLQRAVSDTLFSQLDTISNVPVTGGSSPHTVSAGNSRKNRKNSENIPKQLPRGTAHNFNPFLKTEQTITTQDHSERNIPPNQRRRKILSNDQNPALFLPNTSGLTERNVSGTNHFNIHRPARDINERVPSRAEALERLEEHYEVQRAEYEAKKREKEAKKREEYLAKYKHVDQGYRLTDGLLDEAAGYAPGYNPIESVDDIRQRQQEQLRQDAMVYRERMREEQERQKGMEQKKLNEKVKKTKHYDAGHRLGSGQGNSRQTSNLNFRNKRRNSQENEKSSQKESIGCVSPDLLLEGETEEEALQRQEEQLILEMLIQGQMEMEADNKDACQRGEILEEFEDNQAQCSKNSEVINQFLPVKTTIQTAKTPKQESSERVTAKQLNQSRNLSSAVSEQTPSKYVEKIEKNKHTNKQMTNIGWNVSVEDSNPSVDQDHLGAKRLSAESEYLGAKGLRNSAPQIPSSPQVLSETEPLPKKPASCVLKNHNGAVLVLRPTPEDLNCALVRRIEVQDEADKLGYSTYYKPHVEQVPLYSNNRFERKPHFDTVEPTGGAIPKSLSTVKPASSVTEVSTVGSSIPPSNDTTAKQEEPAFDHKAELRAARLRFQQQYEEALKKKQEQRDES